MKADIHLTEVVFVEKNLHVLPLVEHSFTGGKLSFEDLEPLSFEDRRMKNCGQFLMRVFFLLLLFFVESSSSLLALVFFVESSSSLLALVFFVESSSSLLALVSSGI
jgi:hypothetical protein